MHISHTPCPVPSKPPFSIPIDLSQEIVYLLLCGLVATLQQGACHRQACMSLAIHNTCLAVIAGPSSYHAYCQHSHGHNAAASPMPFPGCTTFAPALHPPGIPFGSGLLYRSPVTRRCSAGTRLEPSGIALEGSEGREGEKWGSLKMRRSEAGLKLLQGPGRTASVINEGRTRLA